MTTSETTRTVMLWALTAAACGIVAANILIVARLLRRRTVARRTLLFWTGLFAAGVICVLDALYWEPDWVQMTQHTIKTDKLPAGSNIRMVHITDLHLFDGLKPRDLKAVSLASKAKPDVIVLTGDYTTEKSSATLSALTSICRQLSNVAPVYAVDGNWDGPEDSAALKKGGAAMLRGWLRLRCRGGGHILVGPADWYNGAFEKFPSKRYRVVLCHAPWHLDKFARQGINLVLCGHTHGGQVRLPFFGALLPNRQLVGDYQAGFYRHGRTSMYLNRGLGMEGAGAPRVRFWCRPEVAVFDIAGTGGQP